MKPDDQHKWSNVEEQLDKAICEIMFNAGGDTPSLGVLLGIFHTPGSMPARAQEHAAAIEALVGENAWHAALLSDEQRIELSNELVSMLRFVCHRGDVP
jgi:hypothetical protein